MKISVKIPSAEIVAVLVGIAVPFLILGKLFLAVLLVVAALMLAWLPGRRAYGRALLSQARTPIGVLVLVTLALWLPGILFSPLPLRSLEAWIRVPIFIAFVTLLWTMLSEHRQPLALTLKALIVASAASALFALCSLTFLPEILSFVRGSGWSPMPDVRRPPNILKGYASVMILVAPVLVWAGWHEGGRWRAVSASTAIGLLAIVWFTYNRSAMAGLLAMLVVGGFLVVALRRDAFAAAAFVVLLAAVMLALVLWLHHTRGYMYMEAPAGTVAILPPWLLDYQRQTIWGHAIDIAMRSPWFGNGINVINLLPGADDPMPSNTLNIIPAHPHNWLVEVFAETGSVGALALLTLVITICLKLAGDFLRYRDTALLAALLVNVGYWGSGLLNFSFWAAWWQVSYLLMTALCLAGRERADGG
jgi:O-antigen ligase